MAFKPRLLLCALLGALAVASLRRRSSGGSHRPGQAHNPLELWNVAGVRVLDSAAASDANEEAPGPRIRANVTSVAGAGAWVAVHWSGLGKGACIPPPPCPLA